MDYYKILGISHSATVSEIKKSYRQLSLQYHPDRNKAADSAERFIEIHQAYTVLIDTKSRSQYDALVKYRSQQQEMHQQQPVYTEDLEKKERSSAVQSEAYIKDYALFKRQFRNRVVLHFLTRPYMWIAPLMAFAGIRIMFNGTDFIIPGILLLLLGARLTWLSIRDIKEVVIQQQIEPVRKSNNYDANSKEYSFSNKKFRNQVLKKFFSSHINVKLLGMIIAGIWMSFYTQVRIPGIFWAVAFCRLTWLAIRDIKEEIMKGK